MMLGIHLSYRNERASERVTKCTHCTESSWLLVDPIRSDPIGALGCRVVFVLVFVFVR